MLSKKSHSKIMPYLVEFMILFSAVILLSVCACNNSGSGPDTESPQGTVSNIYGCKMFDTPRAGYRTPSGLTCIEYEYDENGLLSLRHINAGFNCCTDISADFSLEDGVIIVTEKEGGEYCHCLCLYDIDYEIDNVPAGSYKINIVELYINETESPIEFDVELSEGTTGNYCVTRDYYPWGAGIYAGQ